MTILMGQPTVALGNAILRARATVNEARVVLGPRATLTISAEAELRRLNTQAKNLFSRIHDDNE